MEAATQSKFVLKFKHEQFNYLPQQALSHSRFRLCDLDGKRQRSTRRAPNYFEIAELRMERCCPSPDRWQICHEHRTRSPLSRLAASGAPRFNRVQGAIHRERRADFDTSERPAGMDLCVYCGVGFESGFSSPFRGVVDTRGAVANAAMKPTYISATRPFLIFAFLA